MIDVAIAVSTPGTTQHRSRRRTKRRTTRTLADGREFSLTTDPAQITHRTPLGTTVRELTGDPRPSMQSAFVGWERYSLDLLSVRTTRRTRTATLDDPSDPLSLASLEETTTVNDATWRSTWDAATRTMTWTSPVGRQARRTYDALGQVVSEQLVTFQR